MGEITTTAEKVKENKAGMAAKATLNEEGVQL